METPRVWKPTPEQQLAIDLYAPYLLVSASAGTGKTKTLIDKVLAALRAGHALDRLLVITFTQKAAQQLKQKLFEELARHEDLRPQRFLLPQSNISTIDAFCGRLLRENAVAVQIDPAFRMLPEPEDRLMLTEILDDLFHHWYLGRAPAAPAAWSSWRDIPPRDHPDHREFLRLVDLCGFRQGREVLKDEIENLLQRARVHPDPDAFVAALEAGLRSEVPPHLAPLTAALAESWKQGRAILDAMLDYAAERFPKKDFTDLARLREVLASAPAVAPEDGVNPPNPAGAITALRRHLETAGFHDPRGPWNLKMPKPPHGTKKYLDPFLDRAKEWLGARDKRSPGGIFTWMPDPPDAAATQYRETCRTLQTLLTLLRQTMERYAHRKREEGFLDFSDLELASRRLLQLPDAPVRKRFDLVLVDEYQDINRLQAEIIAGFAPARGRFLVGDTKQCIYQFRLSDPGIFRDYFAAAELYKPGPDAPRQLDPGTQHARLFLSHNFRSRYPILALVNAVFSELLSEAMIGGRYEDEALHFSATQGLAPEMVAALPPGPARLGALDALPEPVPRTPPESVPEPLPESWPGSLPGSSPESSPESPSEADGFSPVEIHLIDHPPRRGESPPDDALIREARFIARRIHELIAGRFQIYDEDKKHWRRAGFGDIAILLRSPGSSGATVARELRRAGIPTLFGVQSFFERQEIRDCLNLLHLLDNAENDIALAGVLRAPSATFTDGDLVHLRLAWPESSCLLAALRATASGEETPWSGPPAAGHPSPAELTRKCHHFLSALESWRSLVQCSDLPSALATVMEESGLMAGVAGDEGGTERIGNLAQLLALTRTYCRERGHSLPGLVRYLAALESAGRGPEPVIAEAGPADAVQILSLHKAKGLEFPIVFLALLGRMINTQDLRKRILTGETWLGVDIFDPRDYVRTPTVARHLLAWQRRRELIEEELRILYVAFTRAREKLIVTGQLPSKWERLMQKLVVWQSPPEVREALIYRVHRPLDWLLGILHRMGVLATLEEPGTLARPDRALIVARHPHEPAESITETGPAEAASAVTSELAPVVPGDASEVAAAERAPETVPPSDALAPWAATHGDPVAIGALLNRLADDLDRPYAHQAATRSRGKYWATEIKRLVDRGVAAEEREVGSALPWDPPPPEASPVEAGEIDGMAVGSHLHAILATLDLTDPDAERSVGKAAGELARRGVIPQAWITPENLSPVVRFLGSGWAAEMRAAGETLEREVSFGLRLAPRDFSAIWPDASELHDREWFLIQGQIDALWRRPDGSWVILDFKSDRVATRAEMAARGEHYRPQMLLYREAVTRLWRAEAVGCILYFLRPGEALPIA